MRLLIVDDEHYIVNYMASLIEEHVSEDLEVYRCYSGIEALRLIETVKMHIILLDINMPGLSGLDAAPKIAEILPDCRIIFLTAYDNFEHIYKSNQLKNSRYLLKTESDEVLLREVSRTIAELKEEADKLHLLSDAEQKSLLLSHLLQQNILKGILSGQPVEKLNNELTLAGSDFRMDLNRPVYLMYTQIHYKTLNERNMDYCSCTLPYLLLMRKLLLDKFLFSMLDMGQGIMFWFFQPSVSFASEFDFLKNMANDFEEYCTSSLHRHTTTVLYPNSSDWNDVCRHCQVIQQYAESSLCAVPLIYSSVNIMEDTASKPLFSNPDTAPDRTETDRQCQELSFYLNQGSAEEYTAILRELRAKCVQIRSMHDISAIRIYNSVSLILLNYIDLYHLQEKIISKIALYPLYYTQDFPTWADAFQYLETLSQHVFEILSSKKLDKNELLINTIKTYIAEHLTESLTLSEISTRVNYNEAYISRLFKQITGMGLSKYISMERISKAKTLLSSTNESMQNIADATGFDTAQYFTIVFKKTTGISPSEYRRSHLYSANS